MKKILQLLLILVFFITINVQPANAADGTYGWTNAVGGPYTDKAYQSVIDPNGNIYVIGEFASISADFDPSSGTDTKSNASGAGTYDIFISKYTSTGAYLWTYTIGGTGTDEAFSATTDTSGNIFIASWFNSASIDYDPTAGTDTKTPNSGSFDMVVTKINSDGTYGWSNKVGGTSLEKPLDIKTDSDGNVYTTGFFLGTVDFDPSGGTDSLAATGTINIFITKYSTSGAYGWTKKIGNATDEGMGLGIDSDDNIYITGFFTGTNVDFDPSGGTDLHSASGGTQDIFLSKFASDGTYGWTKTMGGANDEQGLSITTDSSNNIYLVGYYKSSSVDFDPSGSTDTHTNNGAAGTQDIFLSKFASDGTYGWTKTMGGTGDDQSLRVVYGDAVYLTGSFASASMDFDPSGNTDTHSRVGSDDIFLTSFSASGTYNWTKTIGGTGSDIGYGISVAANGAVAVAGGFEGTVDFDPSSGTDNKTSNGQTDIFTSLYSGDSNAPAISLNAVTPNPTRNSSVTVTGTATDSLNNVSNVQFQLDVTSGSWTACTADDGAFDEASEIFTCSLTSVADGSHTVYVRATDSVSNTTSSGSESSVTFVVDTTVPTKVELESPGEFTNETRPVFRWKLSSDSTSGLSKYKLYVSNGDSGDFSVDDIPVSGSVDLDYDKYLIHFGNFNNGDPADDYISVYTKSSSQWSNWNNDGKLKEGKRYWSVTAYDSAGNESTAGRDTKVDLHKVDLSNIDFRKINNNLVFTGSVSDSKYGSNISKNDYIRSNPGLVRISLIDVTGGERVVASKSFVFNEAINDNDISASCETDLGQDILSCDFSITFSGSFTNNYYRVNYEFYDKANNQTLGLNNIFLSESGVVIVPTPQIFPNPPVTPIPLITKFIENINPISGGEVTGKLMNGIVKSSFITSLLLALPTLFVILGPASLAFGSLWYYLTRLIVWLRGLIYFSKKKHRPWGVVYDGLTKHPIPGAIVRLYKQTGELVETEVTGKTGAFSFLPKLGEYTLKVMMPGFIYPSKLVTGTTDGEYGPLYYGSSFEIKDLKSVINYNIPLDPIDYHGAGIFNSFNRFIHHQQQWLEILLITLGSFASIVAVVENPILFNYAILGFYFLMFLYVFFRRLSLRVSWGTVTDENNQPVPNITLSLLESEFGRLVQRRVTDFTGRYQFIVPKGEYKLLVTSPGYELLAPKTLVNQALKVKAKEELIKSRLIVKKLKV